jgi:homoserine dehydrogenase
MAGFGRVGRAFVSLLQEKADTLRARHDLELRLRAIVKSDGGLLGRSGSGQGRLPDIIKGPLPAQADWRPGLTVNDVLEKGAKGVFVECIPSNIRTGEPGLGYIRTALKAGWHVVTAGKGPLLVDFKGLRRLARVKHLSLEFSAASAAALPTVDVGTYSLAGAEVLSIEGILNGTTNYILTKMGEGVSYEDALREAQSRGIAEPDPALDVEGWDTAVKILLIANSVLGLDLTLDDVHVEGILEMRPVRLKRARQQGKALKLIGRIHHKAGRWRAEVGPVSIDRTHPLFGVSGTNKGITFETDTMGFVTLTGGKSDPRGAAAALLKDIIHIYCS